MIKTCYVLEDGSVVDPSEVRRADGVLRHRDGRAVAMRGDVPRSRSIEIGREMRPEQPVPGYVTRDGGTAPHPFDPDGGVGGSAGPEDRDGTAAALRVQYQKLYGKRPFMGWDAATLRDKIAAGAD